MLLFSLMTQLLTLSLATGTLLWNWALTPLSTTDFGDRVGYKPTKLTSKAKLRSNDALIEAPKKVCEVDRDCERRHYCDTHYGSCAPHKAEGEFCREDRHCKKGLDCMFGICTEPILPPKQGARCKRSSDCTESQCCARQHGEKVCKSKLPEGALCYIPEGGLQYLLNELCPCEGGLICSEQNIKTREVKKLNWMFTQKGTFICAPTNTDGDVTPPPFT